MPLSFVPRRPMASNRCLFNVLAAAIVVITLCLIVTQLVLRHGPATLNWLSPTLTDNTSQLLYSHRSIVSQSPSVVLYKPAPLSFDPMSWTSLQNGTDKATKFISAYYEGRRNAPHAASVYVLGYHLRKLEQLKFFCHVVYEEGRTSCLHDVKIIELVANCSMGLSPKRLARSHAYACTLECKKSTCSQNEIPVFVALSRSSDCNQMSGLIPVRNRVQPVNQKSFGVCVQTPLHGKSLNLQQISEFIEVNRAIGADIIYLYVINMKEDLLKSLLEKYSKEGILQLIHWKAHTPIHYFGQVLSMHDCLHRSMFKVKYLAFNDLDELLLPMKHKTWFELLDEIGNPDDYHSYRFGNCFYVNDDNVVPEENLPCKKISIPRYFQSFDRRKCKCGDGKDPRFVYRTKFMVRTEYIVDMFIHFVCTSLKGKEFKVSNSLGVNAHYRKTVPSDCGNSSVRDTTLLKYKSQVLSELDQRFCH